MGWELVIPTGTRALNVDGAQAGGAQYPLSVEWDDTINDVHVHGESNPLAQPLTLTGRLMASCPNQFGAWAAFVEDLQAATAIRYYPDGSTTYWERAVAGPIKIEAMGVYPDRIRWRVELAVTGDWRENGTQARDWL